MFGYVAGLPAFLAYFAIGLAAYAIFARVYTLLTPHEEIKLIRSGNLAAVTAFLGALIGFSLPLSSAAANSVSVVDYIIWAIIGTVMQVLAFLSRASRCQACTRRSHKVTWPRVSGAEELRFRSASSMPLA